MSQAQDSIPVWHTLRGRLTIILLLALLPVVAFSLAEATREVLSAQREDRVNLEQLAKLITDEHKLVFNSAFQVLAVLQHQPEVESPHTPDCHVTLERAVAGSFDIANIYVVDGAGLLICSSAKLTEPIPLGDTEWFRAVTTQRKPIVGGPLSSPLNGQTIVMAAVPLTLKGETETGAVAVSVYRGLLERIQRLAETPADVSFYLVNAEGHVLLAPPGASNVPPLDTAQFAAARAASEQAVPIEVGDKSLLAAVVPIADGAVYGVVMRPAMTWSRGRVLSVAGQIVLPILLTAFALFIVWLATERNVVRWVRHLRAITVAYRRGNMKVRTQDMSSAPRELAQLGKTLEQMADSITDRETRLVENLAQQQALLREVHHRVKNNLQIITSLLNLQARGVETPQEEAIIREIQARVEAVALVHRGISSTHPADLIDLRSLLPQLADQLSRYYTRSETPIEIVTKSDEVLLTVDESIPFAQLVTEAVINCYKHAFPAGRGGEIRLFLTNENGSARLEISDNGVGIPATEKESPSRVRMGRTLIGALAHQIGGTAETLSEDGTQMIVRFPYHHPPGGGGTT